MESMHAFIFSLIHSDLTTCTVLHTLKFLNSNDKSSVVVSLKIKTKAESLGRVKLCYR